MKLFAVLALSTLSLPAMSQTCYVDLIVKNTGRVVQTFIGYGDSTCLEGMKKQSFAFSSVLRSKL